MGVEMGPNPAEWEWAKLRIRRLSDALAEVVLGQERAIESLVATLLGAGHSLLVGVPGVAKTLLCKTLAARVRSRPHGMARFPGSLVRQPGVG